MRSRRRLATIALVTGPSTPNDPAVAAFIARWRDASGTELANYQLFVVELALLLGVPTPEPAREDTRENAYVFERRVTLARGDGSSSEGRIDCYRRGAFVLEAKKLRASAATRGFDDALLRAHAQAQNYARALPAAEGRPPFLLVVDVGHLIEVYAEFTRSGATYTPYPDPRSHRIRLDDLARPDVRELLRAVWLDPLALDPARRSARVTREIAEPAGVCSPCSPRTSACCRAAPSPNCWSPTASDPTFSPGSSRSCGPTWTVASSRRCWRSSC